MSALSPGAGAKRQTWREAFGRALRAHKGKAKLGLYLAGAAPGLYALALGLRDELGADPVATLERLLGLWALKFLVAGLCVTPLRRLARIDLLVLRRPLGVLAFFYALAHFAAYLALDRAFDWTAIAGDFTRRPYILVGFACLLLLAPLAITSNDVSIRKLGGARWALLHKAVYGAAILAALHFLLLVKAITPQPALYAGAVGALLAWRFFSRARRGRS